MKSESKTWEWVQERAYFKQMNPDSLAEEELLPPMTDLGFIFQHAIKLVGPRGKVKFEIFDFYHPELKVAVEVDGGSHRNKKGSDARRDRMCAYNGIRVLRVTNKEALKGAALEKIKEFLNGEASKAASG